MHGNNFDFLRVLAASLVLFSHQFPLTGRPEPRIFGWATFGGIGVLIFFCISGYLVAQSWERDPHAVPFLAKRILRIWPGLFGVTIVTALLFGPYLTVLPLPEYFSSPLTLNFFGHLKLSGVQDQLPGVFASNPLPKAVNGSLWTISVEVYWYCILFGLGLLGMLRSRYLLLLASIAYFSSGLFDDPAEPRYRYYFGVLFLIGACLNCFRDVWKPWQRQAVLVLLCVTLSDVLGGSTRLLTFVFLPFLVIAFGDTSTPFVRRFGRYGDFSYGIYIYAWPVQQAIVSVTQNQLTVFQGLVASGTFALTLAFLSWHLVEAPALRLKDRFAGRTLPKLRVVAAAGGPNRWYRARIVIAPNIKSSAHDSQQGPGSMGLPRL